MKESVLLPKLPLPNSSEIVFLEELPPPPHPKINPSRNK